MDLEVTTVQGAARTAAPEAAPERPSPGRERLARALFVALAPRFRTTASPPPGELAPFERLTVERAGRGGVLDATFYPAPRPARGGVLFAHPWMPWGQGYFHRRGRIEAVRAAGYHALSFDLSGFGMSSPPMGFFDRDVEDALVALAARCPGGPLHVWSVSSGGYWAHPMLVRSGRVCGAFFEDVSPHLLEWSSRAMPLLRPALAFFRLALPDAYRYLDLRRHAPHLRVRAVAYVSGELDGGVRPDDTRELARRAGGAALIVPRAGHLASIKRARDAVVSLALDTFARAERS